MVNVSDDLWNVFKTVMTYRVEDSYLAPANPTEKALQKGFYDHIYEPRSRPEEILKSWLTMGASALGVVLGVQGSGKSTVVKRITDSLDQDKYPTFLLNFGVIYGEELEGQQPESWKQTIDRRLKGLITKKYFKSSRIDKYYKHFLYEDERGEETFGPELNRIRRLHLLSKHEEDTEDNPHLAEPDWFDAMRTKNEELRRICDDIDTRLTVEHYLRAAHLSQPGKITAFIICLDNVDVVHRQYQPWLYRIAQQLREAHVGVAKVLITTRKETCHPPQAVCNQNLSPILTLGVYGDKNSTILEPEEFWKMVTRRLNYFRECPKDKAEHTTSENLITITQLLRGEYEDDGEMVKLANQSIRDSLRYHCDFLEYILNEYSTEEFVAILHDKKSARSFVLSCLYGWLTKHGSILQKHCLDLLELVLLAQRHEYKGIKGCDITYLILVAVHNMTRRNYRNPRFHDVCTWFRPLNCNVDQLREAVFRLWELENADFGYVLSVYQHPLPETWKDIQDGAELELNYRGEALIKRITVSFTFLNRLLFEQEPREKDEVFYPIPDRERITRYYDILNIGQHAEFNTKLLFAVAHLHAFELHRIRTAYACVDWSTKYRRDFCIDKTLQLTRAIRASSAFINRVLEQNASELLHTKKESLNWNIAALKILEQLYETQVEYFTDKNIEEKRIIDFRKMYKEMVKTRRIPEDVKQVMEDPTRWLDVTMELDATQ